MKLVRLFKALFLIGSVQCTSCRRQVSLRALSDADLRELLLDEAVICTGCEKARRGTDPWKITFIVDT